MTFFSKLIKVFFCKKELFLPKKNKILVVDEITGRKIFKHIKNNFTVMYTRLEKINIPILFLSFKDFLLGRGIMKSYYLNYINFVKPELVISTNDFDKNIWELKRFYPNIKTIIIQNSIRNGWDFASKLMPHKKFKKENIDYCLTLGDGFQKIYRKIFKSKFLSIGSIKNNQLKNSNKIKNDTLIFISQFKNFSPNDFTMDENGNKINLFESYFKSDKILLDLAYEFCKKNKKKLFILCRSLEEKKTINEISYYNKILQKKDIKYIRQSKGNDCYKITNKYSHFVSIDSTLAYECLARNKRTGYINFRYMLSNFSGGKKHRYGFPNNFPDKGLFWSNDYSKKEVFRVLNNLFFTKKGVWEMNKKKYVDPIIKYDYKNQALENLINKILSNENA